MGKQKKRYIQRVLCGILCSAMIAASLIVPDMTVYAAPGSETQTAAPADNGGQNVENPGNQGGGLQDNLGGEDNGTDGGNDSAGGQDDGDNPDDGNKDDGANQDDDANKDDDINKDDDANKDDDTNKDDDVNKDDDTNQDDDADKDDGTDEEAVEKESENKPMATGAARAYGTLQNGDFEEADNSSPKYWTVTGGMEYKAVNTDNGGNNTRYLYKWQGSFSASQIIQNVEPANYIVTLQAGGMYDEGGVNLTVDSVDDDGAVLSSLETKSLGTGTSNWGGWQDFESKKFEVSVPSGKTQANLKVTISGETSSADGAEGFYLDNVTMEKAPDGPTEKMFYYYCAPGADETAPLSLGVALTGGDDKITTSETEKLAGTDYFKMQPVNEGKYADWYQIPLTIDDTITGNSSAAGFAIYKGAEKIAEFSGANHKDIYQQMLTDETKACAVKNGKGYVDTSAVKNATAILRSVTFHAYSENGAPAFQLDKTGITTLSRVDESTGVVSAIVDSGTDSYGKNIWKLDAVADAENWYELTFVVPGNITFDGKKALGFEKEGTSGYVWDADFVNGKGDGIDITPVFAGQTWYKDSQFFAKNPDEPSLEKLKELIAEAEALQEKDYQEAGWTALQTELTTAKAVVTDAEAEGAKPEEDPLKTRIKNACQGLSAAIKALVAAAPAEINVKKVALSDDFITGADLSSYIALRESGVEFKDENGNSLSDAEFFKYMKDGGTNWIRIRIWNDPYDASGNGYGGGNNDLPKAIKLGKLATNAGMKVLIDFHYSDFWADPTKQKAPKAWANDSVDVKAEKVKSYTIDSLTQLKNAGVNVCMVQVGNETNNGICGVNKGFVDGKDDWSDMAKIFNAGSAGVREVYPTGCKVAVHFTDPHKGFGTIAKLLHDNNVDYDVFASSFYPFGHGNTAKVRDSLAQVATDYGKEVMVVETSWPTTLIDGDGLGMLSPVENTTYSDEDYGVSVQGQADEMRDLIDKVNQINSMSSNLQGKAIGVFYWEPAWISPYYIKDENGNDNMALYKKNQEMWEKYGSGWASSYSIEYDPDDAGVWYGGSAMDNSSWFDFDGTALPTAKIYSLIRAGASTGKDIEISSVQTQVIVTKQQGTAIDWNADELKPIARYDDGKTSKALPVTWNRADREDVDKDTPGVYTVHGTAVGDDVHKRNYPVTLLLTITKNDEKGNWLQNPGFENGASSYAPWVVTPASNNIKVKAEDPHNKSTYGLHFWEQQDFSFELSQTIENPAPGTYRFGAFIQGGGADNEKDVQYAFVELTKAGGSTPKIYRKQFELDGWLKWNNPEIKDIIVEEGDKLKVGVKMQAKAETWGTIDDCYLYSSHNVTVETVEPSDGGTVTPSTNRADCGDRVMVTVQPTTDSKNSKMYYLKKLTLDGCAEADVTETDGGTVSTEDGKTVITWSDLETKVHKLAFTMPKAEVKVSAEFENLLGEDLVSINGKTGGNYLVTVNGDATETPIGQQLYSGKAVKPALKLHYKGYELVEGKDYSASYKNNSKKTTETTKAEVTLKGKGKFTGERTIAFEIIDDPRTAFDTRNLKIVFDSHDKDSKTNIPASQAVFYLGKEDKVMPAVKIYAADDKNCTNLLWEVKELSTDKQYLENDELEVHFQNNKKIGRATIVVIPKSALMEKKDDDGKYIGYRDGSLTATFSIAKCPLNQQKVEVLFPGAKDDKGQYYTYYTGGKLQPLVTVRYNGRTLTRGTDYTLSYSNNVNANMYVTEKDGQGHPIKWEYKQTNRNSDPAIRITGKGNFSGTRATYTVNEKGQAGKDKITFNIRPRGIQNATITVEDLVAKTGKQTPKVTVKDNGKTVASSQYEIVKIAKVKEDGTNENPLYEWSLENKVPKVVFSAGTYAITVAGKEKSNYADWTDPNQIIAKKDQNKLLLYVKPRENLIKNVSISVKGNFYYTGEPIVLHTEQNQITDATVPDNKKVELIVKDSKNFVLRECKRDADGNYLPYDASNEYDYKVEYENNVNAGRAQIMIVGREGGTYEGQKKAYFTIGKRSLVAVGKIKDKDKPTELKKKSEVDVPSISFGKAMKEWNAYAASVSGATYEAATVYNNKTNPKPLQKLKDLDDGTTEAPLVIPYTGQVTEPAFSFRVNNKNNAYEDNKNAGGFELRKNDYKLSYSIGNQKKVSADGKTYLPVTVTLTGKGNYSGSVKFESLFALESRSLTDFDVSVASTTYNGKAQKPEVIFREKTTGKTVNFKPGTAYSVSYSNNTDATDNPKNVSSTGKKVTLVKVTVKGKGWVIDNKDPNTKVKDIGNKLSETEAFRIERAEITKACVGDVVFQTFLGRPLKPKAKVVVNGRTLREGTDYEIKYDENIKRGQSGKVIITGKGNYFTRKPIERTFVIK